MELIKLEEALIEEMRAFELNMYNKYSVYVATLPNGITKKQVEQ